MFTTEIEKLDARLEKELYTVVTGGGTKVHLNGYHKYAVLLLGMRHVNGMPQVTMDNSTRQMVIFGTPVEFSGRVFTILAQKNLVRFKDYDEYRSQYYYDDNLLRDVKLLSAGWDAFGALIADFMLDPTSSVTGLYRSVPADTVTADASNEVADMGRFACITFDD